MLMQTNTYYCVIQNPFKCDIPVNSEIPLIVVEIESCNGMQSIQLYHRSYFYYKAKIQHSFSEVYIDSSIYHNDVILLTSVLHLCEILLFFFFIDI